MKRLLGIAIFALAFLCGCGDDEDVFTNQQTDILRYLTSTRRLIPETEIENVIEDNPAFYTEFGRSAYRYITTYYDADREEWSEVEPGSTVDLLFDAYVFGSSEPSLREVYWSNVGSTISALESQSVNPIARLDWSTEPLTVTVGSTKMIKGLEQALVGCRDQDSVQIYMTYNMAYGKNLVGTVPKNSSVAWYIKILRVTK
jgi:hypothetical protein